MPMDETNHGGRKDNAAIADTSAHLRTVRKPQLKHVGPLGVVCSHRAFCIDKRRLIKGGLAKQKQRQ